jgi:nitroreductase
MNSDKEFFTVLNERFSVRAFKKKDIEKGKLDKILRAANSAPSAGNLQSYKIIVIKNRKNKESIASAAFNQDFISQAPVVLIFCADQERSSARYGRRGYELYSTQDATIAASYAQLAAAALGLGSVWVGAFDEFAVKKIVNADKPIAIIPVGYPDERPQKKEKRSLDEIVHKEKM